MQAWIQSTLEHIVHDPNKLPRFVNTLSYLEHIGSRKILHSTVPVHAKYLQHAAEEARHALFFKRAIRHLTTENFDTFSPDNTLAFRAAQSYFQRLDAGTRSMVRSSGLHPSDEACYVLVTYLIELRASTLYPALDRLFRSESIPINLRPIIGEEETHLEEMQGELESMNGLTKDTLVLMIEQEETLFDRFFSTLRVELVNRAA